MNPGSAGVGLSMVILIGLALAFLLGWFRGRRDLSEDMQPALDELERTLSESAKASKTLSDFHKTLSDFHKPQPVVTEKQLFTKPELVRMLHCEHRNVHPSRFRDASHPGYANTVCFDCRCEVKIDRLEFYSVALILSDDAITEDEFLQANTARYNQALALLDGPTDPAFGGTGGTDVS
jgi:hypothetical protein